MKEYKPCRLTECYKKINNKIEIMFNNEEIKLNEITSIIWEMADGRHTIEQIANTLLRKFNLKNKETVIITVADIIRLLSRKRLLFVNWDPLYKFDKCQEI